MILQLKVRRIRGPGLAHGQRELAALQVRFEPLASRLPEPLRHQLAAVNAALKRAISDLGGSQLVAEKVYEGP